MMGKHASGLEVKGQVNSCDLADVSEEEVFPGLVCVYSTMSTQPPFYLGLVWAALCDHDRSEAQSWKAELKSSRLLRQGIEEGQEEKKKNNCQDVVI